MQGKLLTVTYNSESQLAGYYLQRLLHRSDVSGDLELNRSKKKSNNYPQKE